VRCRRRHDTLPGNAGRRFPETSAPRISTAAAKASPNHDTTAGNSGGQYRSGDVDIEAASEGGYDVGWTSAGEWLNYTTNVAAAGSYVVQLRVASPGGAGNARGLQQRQQRVETVSIPATGGWQNWTTVSLAVTLGAGVQQMTLLFDTGGMNFQYARVTAVSSTGRALRSAARRYRFPERSKRNISTTAEKASPITTRPAATPAASTAAPTSTSSPSSEGGYDVGWNRAGRVAQLFGGRRDPWCLHRSSARGVAGRRRDACRVQHAQQRLGAGVDSSHGRLARLDDGLVTVTLGAGTQQMTHAPDTSGFNLNYIAVAAASGVPPVVSPPPANHTGTVLPVVEWNIEINDGSSRTRAWRWTCSQARARGRRWW